MPNKILVLFLVILIIIFIIVDVAIYGFIGYKYFLEYEKNSKLQSEEQSTILDKSLTSKTQKVLGQNASDISNGTSVIDCGATAIFNTDQTPIGENILEKDKVLICFGESIVDCKPTTIKVNEMNGDNSTTTISFDNIGKKCNITTKIDSKIESRNVTIKCPSVSLILEEWYKNGSGAKYTLIDLPNHPAAYAVTVIVSAPFYGMMYQSCSITPYPEGLQRQ